MRWLSELVAQRELHVTRVIYRERARTQRGILDSGIESSEGVPIKRIEKFGLQNQCVRFKKADAFDDREVLVDVSLAANFSRDAWHVAKCESSRGHKPLGVGIQERRTIEEGGITRNLRCKESGIRILGAAAVVVLAWPRLFDISNIK